VNFEWDPLKDKEVRGKHGISFDEVVNLIGRGFLLRVLQNPSQKHRGQKVFLVLKGRSVYMVPFEKQQSKYRLITAFHSRFFTEKHRSGIL
jgi:uncharacterized DUF497 family protein